MFADEAGAAVTIFVAHCHIGAFAGRAGFDGALYEFGGFGVFHGDVAGRPSQIGLLQAQTSQRRVVIGIAEEMKHQFEFASAFRQHLTYREGVMDLLDDRAREQGVDVVAGLLVEFPAYFEQAGIDELEAGAIGGDVIALIVAGGVIVILRRGGDEGMHAQVIIHQAAPAHIGAIDVEGGVK